MIHPSEKMVEAFLEKVRALRAEGSVLAKSAYHAPCPTLWEPLGGAAAALREAEGQVERALLLLQAAPPIQAPLGMEMPGKEG